MYLQKIIIRNIKCFEQVTIDFSYPDGSPRLWNVIIGENGTGKTTLLRAIAIALMGQKSASVLLPRPVGWVRGDSSTGEIEATIVPSNGDTMVSWEQSPDTRCPGSPLHARYVLLEQNEEVDGSYYEGPTIVERVGNDRARLQQAQRSASNWFSAGYA